MHSNRLLSCIGVWFVSAIAVVQCFTDYDCGNNFVVKADMIQTAYDKIEQYLRGATAAGEYPNEIRYNGNLASESIPTYFWLITESRNSYNELTERYFILTSQSGAFLGILSTGWMLKIGTNDTLCHPV
ncbi:Bgt-50516 [Blumeria graminis f. sp. tritici]|uniref:Bgt-50516 n=1 Tax=Blumeria graminis f. sp. tritici TaxID=62690 RepID=A0A9X9MHQ1_BLUGR|nr:Bgt-50516 [Blumeria graminis f. sp. tritici]